MSGWFDPVEPDPEEDVTFRLDEEIAERERALERADAWAGFVTSRAGSERG